jgi:hypothetical protein
MSVDSEPTAVHEDAPKSRSRLVSFVAARSYALVAAVVVVAMTGWTLNQAWSVDFWNILGPVREFARAPLSPANPLITGNAAHPYMTPYAFVLGLLVRASGLDPVTVLAVAGMGSLVLLLYALRSFVRCVSNETAAPALTLVFTLTAWGWNPWRWSGFFDLNSLGAVLPLASTLASALGLIALAGGNAWLRVGRRWGLFVAGVCAPLALLLHPITAVWVGAIGAGFVASELSRANAGRLLTLMAVLLGAAALALAWPFFSILRFLGHSGDFDTFHAPLYEHVVPRTFLALPGFVILVLRFRRCHRDPLALAAAFTGALYVGGTVLGHQSLGRVLPGLMLTAHVAMAICAAELFARRDLISKYAAAAVVVIVAVGFVGSLSGAVRTVPRSLLPGRYAHDRRLASLVAPYRPAARLIHRDDTVVASQKLAFGVAGSSGKLIAPPAHDPFVKDAKARRLVVYALLSPRTPTDRYRRLLDRYCVRWFVVTPFEAQRLLSRADARILLRRRAATKTMVVYEVRRSNDQAARHC